MFMLHMPLTFKPGDSADCRINKKPARVTWLDKDRLRIEPDDVRIIAFTVEQDGLLKVTCGDADETMDDVKRYYLLEYDDDGNFLVTNRRNAA